ncbi:MAG TPA: hypothetical protein VE988_26620 [Gemmataceae bacterium]|nr:hypothetical protein [Gemmataceae bacterium]
MTEQEWLTCIDPWPMLEFLRGKASDRKLRLFAVACHRHIWHLLTDATDSRKTLEFAERFADGFATTNDLHGRAWGTPGSAFSVVLYKAWDAAENAIQFTAAIAKDAVLRKDSETKKKWHEIFDAASEDNSLGEAMRIADAQMPAEWLGMGEAEWANERARQCELLRDVFGPTYFRIVACDRSLLTSGVGTLAQIIYDDRAYDRLPILADALEEAGCDNQDILAHCRGPGPHVRGCWVLDFLLGKE